MFKVVQCVCVCVFNLIGLVKQATKTKRFKTIVCECFLFFTFMFTENLIIDLYVAWQAALKLIAQGVKTVPSTAIVGAVVIRHGNTNCESLHDKLELTHPYRRSTFVPIALPATVQKCPTIYATQI